MIELTADHFASVQTWVCPDRVPAQAVLAGYAPGRVFVNQAQQPTAAFIWDEFRFCYLAGDHADTAFVSALADQLAHELYPAARISHDPTLILDPDSPAWLDHLDQLVTTPQRVLAPRQMFTFNAGQFALRDWASQVPANLRVERITGDLAHEIIRPLVGILWSSLDDFLAHGVGFCVLEGDTVASACFAAFAANQRLEISIETHPDYRQQGLATVCGAAFISYCLDHDLEPVWECWDNNLPSIRLAAKLGFQPTTTRTTCFVNLVEEA